MAATRTLLLVFTSILLLLGIFWFTPLSHHSSPRQAYQILVEALTNHKSSPTPGHPPKEDLVEPLIFLESKPSNNIQDFEQDSNTYSDVSFGELYKPPVVEVDEKDVVELSGCNFSHFLAKNRYVLVNFYAPWCCYSKKLVPDYAAAASMLKGEGSQAVLAKVDCTIETELARKYHIMCYPSLYFFVDGVYVDQYFDDRTSEAMVTWVKSKMILGVYNITTTGEAKRISTAGSTTVLGFFDTLEGSDSKELIAASKLHTDVNFYQTDSVEVAKVFHIDPQIKRPALVMLEKKAENCSCFDGQFTRSAIANFVSMNKLPLVITFTKENAPLIFDNPMKQLWLFASTSDSENVMSTFQEAAKAFKGKLLFVYVEMGYEYVGKRLSHEIGVTGDAPKVIAYTGKGDSKNYVLNGELTLSNIKLFGVDFLEDKLINQLDPNPKITLKTSITMVIYMHSHAFNPSSFDVK